MEFLLSGRAEQTNALADDAPSHDMDSTLEEFGLHYS